MIPPTMVADSIEWDPSKPLLGGLLARMEALEFSFARVLAEEVTYSLRVGAQPPLDWPSCTEPFNLDGLLAEQMTTAERTLAVLRGTPTEHHAVCRSRLQTLVPGEVPAEGRLVPFRIQVRWTAPREMFVHVPMLLPDAAVSAGPDRAPVTE